MVLFVVSIVNKANFDLFFYYVDYYLKYAMHFSGDGNILTQGRYALFVNPF